MRIIESIALRMEFLRIQGQPIEYNYSDGSCGKGFKFW